MSIFLHSSAPVIKPPSSSSQHAAQVPKPQSFPLKNAFPRKICSAHMATDPKDVVFRTPSWRSGDNDLYTRILKLNAAFQYFEDMVGKGHKPDVFDATQLLYDLTKSNRLRKAIRVMELIVESGGIPDAACYTFVVTYMCKRGKLGHAIQLVEKMEEHGVQTNTTMFNPLVEGLCRSGGLSKSLEFIERMMQKGFVPDAHTFSILLEACCKERGVDVGRRIVDDIVAKRGTLHLKFYNAILAGLCNEDRVDEAIRLFRDLPAMGFCPNVVTYNILLKSLCYEGLWQEAYELLDEMIGNDLSPTIGTHNILLGSLAFHGKTDQALKVLDDLLLTSKKFKFKLNASSYNPVIERLCKERKVDDVVKRLDEMIRRKCFPNDETYRAIAVLCEEGGAQEAFSVIQSSRNEQSPLSVHDFYKTVIASLCRKGKTYVAFRILYEMTSHGFTPDSITYSTLIKGLCSEKMLEAAIGMFTVMEEENVYQPDVGNFNALLLGLCKCGRIDLSFDAFETMIRKGYIPNQTTYTILVEGILRREKDLGIVVLKELLLRGAVSLQNVERLAMQYDLLI